MAIGAGRGQYLSPEEYARMRREGFNPIQFATMSQLAPSQPSILIQSGRGVLNPIGVNSVTGEPLTPGVPQLPPPVEVATVPSGPAEPTGPAAAAPAAPAPASPLAAAMQGGTSLGRGALSVDPQQAIYEGALQAGVGLLSNADPRKAIAAGFEGFNKGYDERLASDRAKQVPKITPIGNGVAALVQYPDGRAEVKPISEVQNFLLGKELLDQLPAAQKAKLAQDEKTRAIRNNYQNTIDKNKLVLSTVDKALSQVNWSSAGAIGQLTSLIGGTPGANLEGTLDTLAGNLGFQELQAMRESSPTGGALGQVAVKELEFLQSTVTSLKQKQAPSQLRENLGKLKEHLQGREQRLREAYQRDVNSGLIPKGSIPELESGGAAPAASGGSRGGMKVPGLSDKAQQYYD